MNRADLQRGPMVRSNLAGVTPSSITPTLMALPIQSSLVLERVHQATEGTSFISNRNGVAWEQRVRTAGDEDEVLGREALQQLFGDEAADVARRSCDDEAHASSPFD